MNRSAGVIMHIASLPGKFGIGTFGQEAYNYADFLYKSGLKSCQLDAWDIPTLKMRQLTEEESDVHYTQGLVEAVEVEKKKKQAHKGE